MILQALYEYYQRCENLAPQGFEQKEIPFLIVIDTEGHFIRLEDTRQEKCAKKYLVVKGDGRSGAKSYQSVYRFWDHYGYVLKHSKEDNDKSRTMAQQQNDAFVKMVGEFSQKFPQNGAFRAVKLFYEEFDQNLQAIEQDSLWSACVKIKGCNMSFELQGESSIVAQEAELNPNLDTLSPETQDNEQTSGVMCLITGRRGPMVRTHTITSIPGGSSAGKIVGFQRNAGYDSYGKEQGANAPISQEAEAAYTTALNTLLSKESRNKFLLNDTTFLFWSSAPSDGVAQEFENDFASFFTAPPKDNPNKNIEDITNLLKAVYSGKLESGGKAKFYLLGLSPNVARISIRVWQVGTVGEFAYHIANHFERLQIVKGANESREYFSLFNLLSNISLEYKLSNLQPSLMASMVDCILSDKPYPVLLRDTTLRRINADHKIAYIRAAILKAYLNSKNRFNNTIKPIEMALDTTNTNQGYLCGRLFATLEKLQEASSATSKLNSTIKDRYYSSASSTPAVVFGQLISLSNHHLAKLQPGMRVYYEKTLGEIIAEISESGFPKHLNLDDQSRFAVGYYHQRTKFFEPAAEKEINQENQ